ncbi:MAG: circadian clock KaiB family protein [bacterium]|nr:circadian clock KaiB family protein [bacterium]
MNKYTFKLFISGEKEESSLLIEKLEEILKKQLNNNFELRIVDILKNPAIAEEDKILIIPTLIKSSPLPVKKIFGDLLNEKIILSYLDIPDKN